MNSSHTIRSTFDDPNLVWAAGLVPALRLAESVGWNKLLDGLTVPSPNPAAKTTCVIGGMLANATKAAPKPISRWRPPDD